MNFKTLPDNPFTIVEHHVILSLPDNPTSDYKHIYVGICSMDNKPIQKLCGCHGIYIKEGSHIPKRHRQRAISK